MSDPMISGGESDAPLSEGSTSKAQDSWFHLESQQGLLAMYIKELISSQPRYSHRRKPRRLSTVAGNEMTDRRRPDGSYGPEYGPLPPEHEYALHRHLSSRRRAPWPLHHMEGVTTLHDCISLLCNFRDRDYVSDDEIP